MPTNSLLQKDSKYHYCTSSKFWELWPTERNFIFTNRNQYRLRNLVLKHYKNLANTIDAKIESTKNNMFSKAEASNLQLKDKGLERL